jgi:hypothetical protein
MVVKTPCCNSHVREAGQMGQASTSVHSDLRVQEQFWVLLRLQDSSRRRVWRSCVRPKQVTRCSTFSEPSACILRKTGHGRSGYHQIRISEKENLHDIGASVSLRRNFPHKQMAISCPALSPTPTLQSLEQGQDSTASRINQDRVICIEIAIYLTAHREYWKRLSVWYLSQRSTTGEEIVVHWCFLLQMVSKNLVLI